MWGKNHMYIASICVCVKTKFHTTTSTTKRKTVLKLVQLIFFFFFFVCVCICMPCCVYVYVFFPIFFLFFILLGFLTILNFIFIFLFFFFLCSSSIFFFLCNFYRKNTKSEPRSSNTNSDSEHITSDSTTSHNAEHSLPKDNENEPKQLNKLQQQLEQLEGQQKKLKASEQIGNDVVTNEQHQQQQQNGEIHTNDMKQETRTAFVNDVVKSGNQKKSNTKAHKQHNATKKVHNSATTANNNGNKSKLKSTSSGGGSNKNGKDAIAYLKAEGSLSGLASLKRVGNVKLATDPEGRNSTIKAKFTLGPLILRVEKSFKRGGVENVKSATARTNEMIGRIKFSVVNDRATLMSIKVQQPKQVMKYVSLEGK